MTNNQEKKLLFLAKSTVATMLIVIVAVIISHFYTTIQNVHLRKRIEKLEHNQSQIVDKLMMPNHYEDANLEK